MKTKWKKVALITGPLLVAGSVYAFAADGGAKQQQAEPASGQGLVTYNIGKAEPLTDAELQALAGAKPEATEEQTSALDDMDLSQYDPFDVQEPVTQTAEQTKAAEQQRIAGAFDLSLVKKLELKTHTTLGELKLEFKTDGGEVRLEGKLGDRKIDVKGDQAYQLLNQLLGSLELDSALTAAIQGEKVTLNASLLGALEKLEVQLADGRKIESKGDNGKHKGHDKDKQKGKGKNKDKNKGKGHDKDDDDDDNDDRDED